MAPATATASATGAPTAPLSLASGSEVTLTEESLLSHKWAALFQISGHGKDTPKLLVFPLWIGMLAMQYSFFGFALVVSLYVFYTPDEQVRLGNVRPNLSRLGIGPGVMEITSVTIIILILVWLDVAVHAQRKAARALTFSRQMANCIDFPRLRAEMNKNNVSASWGNAFFCVMTGVGCIFLVWPTGFVDTRGGLAFTIGSMVVLLGAIPSVTASVIPFATVSLAMQARFRVAIDAVGDLTRSPATVSLLVGDVLAAMERTNTGSAASVILIAATAVICAPLFCGVFFFSSTSGFWLLLAVSLTLVETSIMLQYAAMNQQRDRLKDAIARLAHSKSLPGSQCQWGDR